MARAAKSPSLPQNDSSEEQAKRARELDKAQSTYVWTTEVPTLPGVPVATKVTLEDDPTLEWLVLTARVGLSIARNLLAVKVSGAEKDGNARGGGDESDELDAMEDSLNAIEKRHLHPSSGALGALGGAIGKLSGLVDAAAGDPHARVRKYIDDMERMMKRMALGAGDVVNLQSYAALFATLPLPPIASNFMEDSTFAWMRVAGPNPTLIRGIESLPEKFPVTAEQYQHAMGAQDDLESALKDGRVYLLDYEELSALVPGTWQGLEKFPYAPLALFAVPRGGRALQPVAIQCGQDPKQHPIFVPATDGPAFWGWQMAKTIVQVAEGNYHELLAHLSRTHLVMEAFTVATHRCLAEQHPIWALLIPHCEGTLFINNSAANSLIAAGGPIDHIFAGTITSTQKLASDDRLAFDFYARMLPADLEARNVADPKKLPDYPYRDDALLVWQAIHDWVEQYVRIYYSSDADVEGDIELSAWSSSLITDGKLRGFTPVTTREQLVSVCQMAIFTASAQHAAVNFPQKPDMSFAPAITGAGWTAAPRSQGDHTKREWLGLMPPLSLAMEQLNTLYLLGSIHYRPLGDYRSNDLPYLEWFQDPAVTQNALPRFQAALKDVEARIDARNAERRWEYTFLKPSLIPTSINI